MLLNKLSPKMYNGSLKILDWKKASNLFQNKFVDIFMEVRTLVEKHIYEVHMQQEKHMNNFF